MMTWNQIRMAWRDIPEVWLDLADSAVTTKQRAYCVKQFQKFKPLPWHRKILKIVLDFFSVLP